MFNIKTKTLIENKKSYTLFGMYKYKLILNNKNLIH